MTNKKTFKFSTLLVITLIAILVVGCKKRPTGIDTSYNTPPVDVVEPDMKADINNYVGNLYKSGNHSIDGTSPLYYYTAKVENGNIVIEQYNAYTGTIIYNPTLWPKVYSTVAEEVQFTLTPQSKDNNIILNGQNRLVTGGTAIFDETGLTIVFKEGGNDITVRFDKYVEPGDTGGNENGSGNNNGSGGNAEKPQETPKVIYQSIGEIGAGYHYIVEVEGKNLTIREYRNNQESKFAANDSSIPFPRKYSMATTKGGSLTPDSSQKVTRLDKGGWNGYSGYRFNMALKGETSSNPLVLGITATFDASENLIIRFQTSQAISGNYGYRDIKFLKQQKVTYKSTDGINAGYRYIVEVEGKNLTIREYRNNQESKFAANDSSIPFPRKYSMATIEGGNLIPDSSQKVNRLDRGGWNGYSGYRFNMALKGETSSNPLVLGITATFDASENLIIRFQTSQAISGNYGYRDIKFVR